MPRVLKAKPVESKIICHDGCKRTIGYVPNDVQRRDGTDYGGGPDGAEFIICPNCGKRIIIRSW